MPTTDSDKPKPTKKGGAYYKRLAQQRAVDAMLAANPAPELALAIIAPAPLLIPEIIVPEIVVLVDEPPAETISVEGRARAQSDEELAIASGFAPKPPIYAIGTPINSIGVENLKRSRVEFEALPEVRDAMSDLVAQVALEQREDIPVELCDLHMSEGGQLELSDGTEIQMTRNGLRLLAHRLIGSYDYMAKCPPALRSLNVNHWLESTAGEKPIVLRTRMGSNGRELYGVVSPRYAEMDVDRVAETIAKIAPAGGRCDVAYDGVGLTVNVLFHTNIEASKGVAGEFFKAGAIIQTRDDGTGSLSVEAELWRNLCLNLIILDKARQTTARRSHVGVDLDVSLTEGIERALAAVAGFAERWSDARTENVIEVYKLPSAEEAFLRLAVNRAVSVPGVRPLELQGALVRAWQKEPGHSRTDIVNAITRAAHEEPWARLDSSELLERSAGQLLYTRDLGRMLADPSASAF